VAGQVEFPNPLGDLFESYAAGDVDSFLAGCSDDLILLARGAARRAAVVHRDELGFWLATMDALSGGTLQTRMSLALSMGEEHLVVLRHTLERDNILRSYETLNRCTFTDGLLRGWCSQPANEADFWAAWGAGARHQSPAG
jgi:hypothetical protein